MIKEKARLDVELGKLKIIKGAHERALNIQYDKISKARHDLQKVCPHTNVVEADASDYHNNTEWTSRTCKDCDKYLGKY